MHLGKGRFIQKPVEFVALKHRRDARESVRCMDQETRWMTRYNEVKAFIEREHRNPSKYVAEERLMVHFLKRGRKMINAGEMKDPRLGLFNELLALSEQNKHKNQYE